MLRTIRLATKTYDEYAYNVIYFKFMHDTNMIMSIITEYDYIYLVVNNNGSIDTHIRYNEF